MNKISDVEKATQILDEDEPMTTGSDEEFDVLEEIEIDANEDDTNSV